MNASDLAFLVLRGATALLCALAARDGRSVVGAMLDIDHFKAINDGWGHGAGFAPPTVLSTPPRPPGGTG